MDLWSPGNAGEMCGPMCVVLDASKRGHTAAMISNSYTVSECPLDGWRPA